MSYESWQLYDFDADEEKLRDILRDEIDSTSVQVLMKREGVSDITPRVELVLSVQGNADMHRALINGGASSTTFLPLDVWSFALSVSVVTNRETNGDQHKRLVGIVREQLTMLQLQYTWTDMPLHAPIEMINGVDEVSFDNETNLDTTKLNFTGMIGIRSGAWALVNTPDSSYNSVADSGGVFVLDSSSNLVVYP